jgi:hypothetical protein
MANMANRPWLEDVQRRLAEGKLPPAYIRRFMEELADHCQDILEETMSKEANVVSRLGNPEQVADAAVIAYERRTLFGRHPSAKVLVFAVSPVASLFGLFLLVFACVYGCFTIYEQTGFNVHIKRFDPVASWVLPYVFSLIMVVIPSALAVVFYGRVAKRCHVGKMWVGISCFVLAIVAITPIWSVTLSDLPNESVLRCGVMTMPHTLGQLVAHVAWYFSHAQQLIQFSAPLVVGLLFVCRSGKQVSQNNQLRTAA